MTKEMFEGEASISQSMESEAMSGQTEMDIVLRGRGGVRQVEATERRRKERIIGVKRAHSVV